MKAEDVVAQKKGENAQTRLESDLIWLADAPLFIDVDLVYRFYDAVVRPASEEDKTTLEITQEKVTQISGKLGIKAGVSPSSLLKHLTTFLPFLNVDIEGSAEGAVEHGQSDQSSRTIELRAIKTPQRQLVSLVLHYLINQEQRLFLVNDPSVGDWHQPDVIRAVPRVLAFLDLPGQEEAQKLGRPETRIIPIAAEFSNGRIERLYERLTSKDGRQAPPPYPQRADTPQELAAERKAYWHWFDDNFNSTKAMQVIEQAASSNGRIQWIAYRLPISQDGGTLHLRVSPGGAYDTGVLAYELIKRGEKHGLRLVGTLKSEPDMNVLAVYDK